MIGMLTTVNIDFRSIGGNFDRSASPVGRISEEIYSLQAAFITYTLRMLAILYGAPSILFKLAAVGLMRNFPIDAAGHRRIRDALAAATPPL